MISAFSQCRFAGLARAVATLIPAALLFVACGGEEPGDPEKFYDDLVTAVRQKDGVYMYDVLDSARRAEIDTLIGRQMESLDMLPAEERARWDALKGKEKRDIYATMIVNDEGVAQMFGGDYKILKVDTLVVLTVQHEGQQPNLMYLRPRKGGYSISFAPRVPDLPYRGMQPPPVQQNGGDSAAAGADSGAQLE